MQDEPPTWPSDSDDNMGLESMSEPDDLDLDDDGEGDGVEIEVDGEANENDNDDEPFFDTQSAGSRGGRSTSDKARSEDVDTEDDPVGPITPGHGSKFEFVDRPEPGTAKPRLKESEEDNSESEDRRGFGDDDIEDDWADPLVSDSNPVPKDTSPSPPSSSNIPRLSKSRPPASGSTKSLSAKSTPSPKVKPKSKKEQPVPVPGVVIPNNPLQVQEHYPFPVTPADEGPSPSPDVVGRSRQSSATRVIRHQQQQQQPGYRMHTARARDGGRTQSGGVKGVLFSEPSSSSS